MHLFNIPSLVKHKFKNNGYKKIINVNNEFCLGNSFPDLRKFPNGVKFKQDLRAIPILIWNHKFHMRCYIISKGC